SNGVAAQPARRRNRTFQAGGCPALPWPERLRTVWPDCERAPDDPAGITTFYGVGARRYGLGASEMTCWYVGRLVVGNVVGMRPGMNPVRPWSMRQADSLAPCCLTRSARPALIADHRERAHAGT